MVARKVTRLKIRRLAVLALAPILIAGCVSETKFTLASESRLPYWFPLPEESRRGDFKVTLEATAADREDESVVKIYKRGSLFSFAQITGSSWVVMGSPENPPVYVAYTFNGVTDIVEHRRNKPVFYMSDDPKIRELGGLDVRSHD